jgi:hypothetical protein
MEKIIFNVGKSFYILSTNALPFQEKYCCINMRFAGLQSLNSQ